VSQWASLKAEALEKHIEVQKNAVDVQQNIACLTLLSLSGCGVTATDTGCQLARPIYVIDHDIDVMSTPTQRQIMIHKETWEKNGFEQKN